MPDDQYAHISEITASLREGLRDARERLASLETHVRIAHVKEMEQMGERIDRLRDNVKSIRHTQWMVVCAILANLAYIVYKQNAL